MAVFTNRPNRMTGMSGLDTETMVRQIMQAESARLHRLQRNRTMLQWRQEAYQDVRTQLNGFHARFLDTMSATSLRMNRTFGNFSTTVTAGTGSAAANSNAVTVTPSAGAQSGNHSLKILQLAQSASVSGTGNKTSIMGSAYIDLSDLTTLASDALAGGAALTDTLLSFNLNLNGTQRTVSLTVGEVDALTAVNGTTVDTLQGLVQSKVDATTAFGTGANRINIGVIPGTGANLGQFRLDIAPANPGHSLIITDTNLHIEQSTAAFSSLALLADLTSFINSITPTGGRYVHTIEVNGRNVEIDFTSFRNNPATISETAVLGRINTALASSGVAFRYDSGNVTLRSTSLFREALHISDDAPAVDNLLAILGGTAGATYHAFDIGPNNSLSFLGLTHNDRNHFGSTDRLGDVFGDLLDLPANLHPGPPPTRIAQFQIGNNSNNTTTNFALVDRDRPTTPAELAALRAEMDTVFGIGSNVTLLFRDDSVAGTGATSLVTTINNANAGVNFTYNTLNQTFTLESTREGRNNGFTLDAGAAALFGALGITDATAGSHEGRDAAFILNGTQTTRESNTFSHDNVTFRLNEVTGTLVTQDTPGAVEISPGIWDHPDAVETYPGSNIFVIPGEAINIGVTRDNTATIQLLRDFVAAYNELRTNLNDLIHTRRPRSMGAFFEPLTDEERRGMSADEIARWEEQARTGIMHRNDILTRMVNQMRSSLFNSVTLEDGSTLSLAQLGISPSNRHEDRGTLVIDEERLAAAVEQHGDRIGQMFTRPAQRDSSGNIIPGTMNQAGLGDRLDDIFSRATHSTRGSISRRAGGRLHLTLITSLSER